MATRTWTCVPSSFTIASAMHQPNPAWTGRARASTASTESSRGSVKRRMVLSTYSPPGECPADRTVRGARLCETPRPSPKRLQAGHEASSPCERTTPVRTLRHKHRRLTVGRPEPKSLALGALWFGLLVLVLYR